MTAECFAVIVKYGIALAVKKVGCRPQSAIADATARRSVGYLVTHNFSAGEAKNLYQN